MSHETVRAVEIEATDAPDGAILIAPRPFDHWGQRFSRFDAEGVSRICELGATNSDCRAYVISQAGDAVRLRYELQVCDDAAADWVWRTQSNRYTTPSSDLIALAADATQGAGSQREALDRIVAQAAEVFGYDHVDEPFNAGHDTVPTICGTAKGSCVDINTYILAAALSRGIKGQYVAGYWFHPEKVETADMHCWLAFETDGGPEPVFWDLAHALKWGAALGARVEQGLNPAGGRRVAMSCGRGLQFETERGMVEISHFSEPVWLTADGAQHRPTLRIRVEDPGGDRAQAPIAAASEAAA